MIKPVKKILIMAGGSGGHIFPALAVAKLLEEQEVSVHWLGSRVGLEKELVSPHFPISYLSIKRLRGKGRLTKLLAPLHIIQAIWQAGVVILRQQPDVVLGMGGFASGPGGIAAWLLRKPLIVHEQNSIAGFTNKILSRLAKRVLCGFPDVFPESRHAQWVGNPVRTQVLNISEPDIRMQDRGDKLRILVLGGSQGAQPLNQAMLDLVKALPDTLQYDIWHQTGEKQYDMVANFYKDLGVHVRVAAFIEYMDRAYSWADIVLCRAGALTISELAAVGLPSILIPFPHAVDNHQLYNAGLLERADAAIVLPQHEMTTQRLLSILESLTGNRERLLDMANNARTQAKRYATIAVGKACMSVTQATKHVHFVGIGGIGMCGLAELLLRRGYRVSGSDQSNNLHVQRLKKLGATIFQRHAARNVGAADLLVYSSAIGEDNPERMIASKKKIPSMRRGKMLAELFNRKLGIAIAGTHGKTTTTGMVAHAMLTAGMDPTYAVGGVLNNAVSTVHMGASRFFIAEADESDATFLYLNPTIAVITNIDADHLDTYQGDFERLKAAFVEFLKRLPEKGCAIVCIDDLNIQALLAEFPKNVMTYGFSDAADFQIQQFEQQGLISQFTVKRPQNLPPLTVRLNSPGRHNVLNATATIAVAMAVNMNDRALLHALDNFPGMGRRFHAHGSFAVDQGEALVFEDYGHHPREVKVTLEATKQIWPDRRVIMVFQPHRYTRTRDLMDEFADVLAESDTLVLLDIYSASEQPIPGITGEVFCEAVKKRGKVTPIYIADLSRLPEQLKTIAKDQDIILLQGAGNVSAFIR